MEQISPSDWVLYRLLQPAKQAGFFCSLQRFGVAFELYTNNIEIARGVVEYLEPYFTATRSPPSPGTYRVYCVELSPDLLEQAYAVARVLAVTPVEADCFLDVPKTQIRTGLIRPGLALLRAEAWNARFLVVEDTCNKVLYTFFSREMAAAGQFSAMRFIRNTVYRHVISDGHLPFHAACVELNGCGLLIIGSKFAGKTTTAVALSAYAPVRIVSNDKVTIDTDLRVHGWPIAVGVRWGTVRLFPELDQYMRNTQSSRYPFMESADFEAYTVMPPDQLRSSTRKVKFAPAEFARLFRRELLDHTAPALIIIPNLDDSVASPRAERVSRTDALEHLKTQVLGPLTPASTGVLEGLAAQAETFIISHNERTLRASAALIRTLAQRRRHEVLI